MMARICDGERNLCAVVGLERDDGRGRGGEGAEVCGGAGFLGSHLCERLLADDNEVISVDNHHTGSRDKIESMLPDRRPGN